MCGCKFFKKKLNCINRWRWNLHANRIVSQNRREYFMGDIFCCTLTESRNGCVRIINEILASGSCSQLSRCIRYSRRENTHRARTLPLFSEKRNAPAFLG
jgi:hypothetical protein